MAIQGVLPVLHVPYDDDDALDVETYRREVDWVFECGADGVVVALASEVFRQTDAERDRLVREAVAAAGSRGPVVASVGAESIAQAVRHAKVAAEAGASAFMAIPPGLTRLEDSEIDRYYAAILDATALPLIIQDASSYVGRAIPAGLQGSLFRRYPERVMFKPEGAPLVPAMEALRDAAGPEAPMFEGAGGLALIDSYRLGVVGTMPGSDLPWAVVAIWRALRKGDEERARRVHAPLGALMARMQSLDAYLAVEKLLLVRQGVFKNTRVRGPVAYRMDSGMEAAALAALDELKEAVK